MVFSQDTTEKVAMEPILTLQNGKAELEFRLGVSRMYILKDLGDFCEKMKTVRKGHMERISIFFTAWKRLIQYQQKSWILS